VPITSFRIASTTRRFERGKGWSDIDTLFVTVVCWRQLAEHVALSFAKGDPVIVTGRLRMRQQVGDDGKSGTAFEVEAHNAGHDLSRGVAAFTRAHARRAESGEPSPLAGPDAVGTEAPGDVGPTEPSESTETIKLAA
jgi:single-strand DNA-binding protein